MTKEEKQLLLKDLCARLPYSVKVDHFGVIRDLLGVIPPSFPDADIMVGYDINDYEDTVIEDIKPYLRPMSSMTEEERKEFSVFIGKTEMYAQQIRLDADSMVNPIIGGFKCVYWGLFDKCVDWLNAHHFDYRGLIEKGLALEAPENMYKEN